MVKAARYVDFADLLPEALRDMQFDNTKEVKAKDETRRKKFQLTLAWPGTGTKRTSGSQPMGTHSQ